MAKRKAMLADYTEAAIQAAGAVAYMASSTLAMARMLQLCNAAAPTMQVDDGDECATEMMAKALSHLNDAMNLLGDFNDDPSAADMKAVNPALRRAQQTLTGEVDND